MKFLLHIRVGEQQQKGARHDQDIDDQAEYARQDANLRVGKHGPVVSLGQKSQDDGEASENDRRENRPRESAENGQDAEHHGSGCKGASGMSDRRRIIRRNAGIVVLPGRNLPVVIIVHVYLRAQKAQILIFMEKLMKDIVARMGDVTNKKSVKAPVYEQR